MTLLRWPVTAACLVFGAFPALAGTVALPDLVAVIDDKFAPTVERAATVHPGDVAEGCAGAVTGRTVVHFALSSFNEGAVDLVLGDPGCPDCQEFPGPTCTNELFECSPLEGHGHPHFTKYALYEIVASADAPAAAAGHKQSFCIEDTLCPEGKTKVFNCLNQGLQVGCQDLYPPYALGCQYVDVTDLPGGRYLLRTTINFEGLLPESRLDNNVDQKPVDVCEGIDGPRVRFRTRKSSPEVWRWKILGKSEARVPITDVDPFKDGAWIRITELAENGELDDRVLVDVELPGRPGSGHCGPEDGWKRDGNSPAPHYVNGSGFVDRDCTVPSDGLRTFRGSVARRERNGVPYAKVRYSIAGTSAAPPPTGRVRVEVGLGIETGPCWTAATVCDGTKRCTGESAAGAFVD